MILPIAAVALALMLIYALGICIRFPHIRRIAAREIAQSKMAALLTVAGLSVGIALITLVVSVRFGIEGSEEDYHRQHFGPIVAEAPAIEQPLLSNPYFSSDEMRTMLESAGDSSSKLLPIVSYAVTLLPSSSVSGERRTEPLSNVLVIGTDLTEAMRWDPALSGTGLLSTRLGADRIVLSRTAAERLSVQEGDTVLALDLNNRAISFEVEKVVREAGLTGYRGYQLADATAIVDSDSARKLFGLPAGSYTSAVGSTFPRPPWTSESVKAGAMQSLSFSPFYATSFFGIIQMNAILMSLILTINLFRLIVEERKRGMLVLRSIGFSRLDLKRIVRLEGLGYAVMAGLAGGAAGIGLSSWMLRSVNAYTAVDSGLTLRISGPTSFKALLVGVSIGIGVVFVCVWLVSQLTLSRSLLTVAAVELGGKRARSSRSETFHTWFALLSLVYSLLLVLLLAVPSVRRDWFVGVDLFDWGIGIGVLLPVVVYSGVRWLEWGCRAALMLLRRATALAGILNLVARQLQSNRLRSGLLILLFACVTFFSSFSQVISVYIQEVLVRYDARADMGGYDYYAEDIRPATSAQLERYVQQAGFSQDESPVVASVLRLPWKESAYRKLPIHGIDGSYAAATTLEAAPFSERSPSDPWREVAEDKDAIVVSAAALRFMNNNGWKPAGDEAAFDLNGSKVKKRIVGVVEDSEYAYPGTSGVWLNAGELMALGQGQKELHSIFFLRFPSISIAKELREKTAQALGKSNVPTLRSAADYEVGYMANIGSQLVLFERFNLLALSIGVAGLSVVMLRSSRMRKDQLGMLRAIGIPPAHLRLYLWLEGALTAAFGTALGFGAGAYSAFVIIEPQTLETPEGFLFSFPAERLIATGALVILVIVVATFWTARSVYQVSAAAATRNHTAS
ncbi:FtsX-like permease family protein [Cohnella faecalis]|uniref:ABC transporter permease n=1 Tax=Cohnella faecalis TaxID=2315694 RepID=A0A398CIA0_9BACL|nr:ABC transporter permease [Cohnella faecalis]RIE02095.1 ABC transporter permease [Cohnella faecalis]